MKNNIKACFAIVAFAATTVLGSCTSKEAMARSDYNKNIKKSEQCARGIGVKDPHKHHQRHAWD